MASYEITKYDPAFRDSFGRYMRDDWTSMSAIGRVHEGHLVTQDEYDRIENAYVDSVRRIMTAVGVEDLVVSDLEISDWAPDEFRVLESGASVTGGDIDRIIRGCLREQIWCRLHGQDGFFVHFGHDYYMWVGFHSDVPLPQLPPGMFVEERESPLMNLDD